MIRLGALTDMSGPYRDVGGTTGTACVQQAIAEFNAENPGIRVEIVSADHQNRPDIASAIVREWFDRGEVDALVQVGDPAVALAANTVAREKDKVHLNTGALSSVLTGAQCSPNLVHGPLDTWSMGHTTATALTRSGGDTWFCHRRLRLRPCLAEGMRPSSSARPGDGWWERCGIRFREPPTSPPSCCRRRRAAPRSSPWRIPAPT